MVVPKYDIGKIVLVYEGGRLVEKIIKRIRIVISQNTTSVGYQFECDSNIFLSIDFWKEEHELFNSIEEFIKLNQPTHE